MVRLLMVFGILTGGGLFGLAGIERKMVFPFDPGRIAPEAAGLSGVGVREIRTDGEKLIVWVAPPGPGKPVILYFHGNAGNLANRADRFGRFIARGYGLIAPAYRGSSGSSGVPSEAALTRDAVEIYTHLDALIPGLTARETVLYGESLGTGVVLKLVSQVSGSQPAAAVLEAPYTSLPDVARHVRPQLGPLIWQMRNRFDSLRHARSLTAPLLVLHGADDPLIPIGQGRQVFDAAASEEKTFLAIPGAGHSDTWRADTLPALWRFIDDRATAIR